MQDDPLRALRTGDEVLFMELFTTVQPRLLRYLTTMVGVDDAADVAGEAWRRSLDWMTARRTAGPHSTTLDS